MNKEQSIKQVDECISSIFSKEDVKQIINKVDSSAPDLERFFKVLEEAFHNSSDQLEVDVEDVSWCIEGDHHRVEVNNIEVENWCFNSDSVEKFMSLFKRELNKLVEDEDS